MTDRRSRDPHDFAACIGKTTDSRDRTVDIKRVLIDHRLHRNRVLTPNRYIADHHRASHPAMNLCVVSLRGGHQGSLESWVNPDTTPFRACLTLARSAMNSERGLPESLEGLRNR